MANAISELLPATAGTIPAATAPNASEASPGSPSIPPQALNIIRGLASGQIPGAVIPSDAPKIETGLTPGDLIKAGIGLYHPRTKGLAGVAFSPEHVSEAMLQKMDKDGTLAKNFPSMTDLLKGVEAAPGGALDGLTPPDGSTQPASADGSPTQPSSVPVLPRPTFGADAQAEAANARLASLNPEPSKRLIPGGGAVLNGLVTRAK